MLLGTAFQATNIHQLHPEMDKLTKRILCYFVDSDVVDIEDITKTPYEDTHHQLGDDKLEIGEEARLLASSLQEDGNGPEVDSFFCSVRTFYATFVKTLIKIFLLALQSCVISAY